MSTDATRVRGRDDTEVLFASDFGLCTAGATLGLDPAVVFATRARCKSDAEAARELGCSPSTVARARRHRSVHDTMIDEGALSIVLHMDHHGGIWTIGALAVALQKPKEWVATCMRAFVGLDLVRRVPGGWRSLGKQPMSTVKFLHHYKATHARLCPRDKSHGVQVGKYCSICRARIHKPAPEKA